TMKEFFAFPMFATMIWLLWVFIQQSDTTTLFLALLSLLAILFLFWIFKYKPKYKILFILLAAASMALPFFFISGSHPSAKINSEVWKPYSQTFLTEELQSGRAVFLDFTASWCITCQVNKRLVLNTK